METLESVRARFAGDVYATGLTGVVIEAVAPDYAKCSLCVTDQHRNAAGSVMGGALFTLADLAFAVAANTGHPLTVTLSSSITYLRAAKGGRLVAEAKCQKSGARACTFLVEVRDEADVPVALVTATGMRV